MNLQIHKRTYTTFIDLEKAFDRVDWKLLFISMKRTQINVGGVQD